MARNNEKTPPLGSSENPVAEPSGSDKPELTADPSLKLMMRVGIPLALLSVLSLWASGYFGSAGIGLLFFICAPLALVIGFAYNIRYVMLLIRRRRNPPPPQNGS